MMNGLKIMPLSFKTSDIDFDAVGMFDDFEIQNHIWIVKTCILNYDGFAVESFNMEKRIRLTGLKKVDDNYIVVDDPITDIKVNINRKIEVLVSGKSGEGYFETYYKEE